MKRRRLFHRILKNSGADKICYVFLAVYLVAAVVIRLTEPTIHTLWDSIWYCFTVVTTVGFGDSYATSVVARIATMVLSVYSIFILAILTAVITDFFIEFMKRKAENSANAFLDKLERLPELSREELCELSEAAKAFDRDRKNRD